MARVTMSTLQLQISELQARNDELTDELREMQRLDTERAATLRLIRTLTADALGPEPRDVPF